MTRNNIIGLYYVCMYMLKVLNKVIKIIMFQEKTIFTRNFSKTLHLLMENRLNRK